MVSEAAYSLVRGVVGVDEDRVWLGVVVVLVVVLSHLPGVVGDGVGSVLASGGDVVSLEDPGKYPCVY